MLTPSPPTANATPSGQNGPLLNGMPDAANSAPANLGGNNLNTNAGQLFGASDVLGDTSLFGTDTDLDWMNSLTAGSEGIDFTLYLENIGEDNEGEVGIA